MDTKEYMIIIKGVIKTQEVKAVRFDIAAQKAFVEYNNGKEYAYAFSNVEKLTSPYKLNPCMYQIKIKSKLLSHVQAIYVFYASLGEYWHICFENGDERDYLRSDLEIVESCLLQERSKDTFEYIKQIAELNELKNEITGEKLLAGKFRKISFLEKDVALSAYLNPSEIHNKDEEKKVFPIFPFGCNNSQYNAVVNAMKNQISVIQGPPGTGKTQTILNIIANILMEGKTVQVVSNNNSATENVYEKLSSPRYNLGFLVAMLGNAENKQTFIETQTETYPDLSAWKLNESQKISAEMMHGKSMQLKQIFDKQEELSKLRQEKKQVSTEFQYFNTYADSKKTNFSHIESNKKITSEQWLMLMQEYQMLIEYGNKNRFWINFKSFVRYGIIDKDFYKQELDQLIFRLQYMYYQTKEQELAKKIAETEQYLKGTNNSLLDECCSQFMMILKDKIATLYSGRTIRPQFKIEDLWKNPERILNEYPIILSTTFSSRNNFNSQVKFDYLIMDEASQVDIATGALALSCARNVIIVGDTKQLPNVVTEEVRKKAAEIFNKFTLNEGYQFTKSFLQSILDVIPNVPQTMLREHYRCHPKIINFCNQKFYKGELIIMTEDKGEADVLTVVKTVPGNHARDHYSQRQIDIIKNEIIPEYALDIKETGIIAPYKNQVEALKNELGDLEIATVHKFQGKEKDTIILSTVDDEISDFADDPYLINVAVSRAKKRLILVVTGNEQEQERNITDLIAYIQYNNFEVVTSKTYSIFDYLYKQNEEIRKAFLQKKKRISEYDSENLMNALIEDILSFDQYSYLDVVCHFPMNMLVKDLELLNERERSFALNPATHVDFLVYNRISKKPVLAVEVDGYDFHKTNSVQASRDVLKDHILELCGISLLRLKTNGSGEREKIQNKLNEILA